MKPIMKVKKLGEDKPLENLLGIKRLRENILDSEISSDSDSSSSLEGIKIII